MGSLFVLGAVLEGILSLGSIAIGVALILRGDRFRLVQELLFIIAGVTLLVVSVRRRLALRAALRRRAEERQSASDRPTP